MITFYTAGTMQDPGAREVHRVYIQTRRDMEQAAIPGVFLKCLESKRRLLAPGGPKLGQARLRLDGLSSIYPKTQ